uniref:FecR family protein n=1 Tax=Pedobacter schmidteae TaxID=2201271 RepID=UPI000EAFA9B7|nr:FecR domain-containing protein [Pedobacter schmidteae]
MQLPKDDFSVEDLVCNESFQQYCLGTELETQILWKEWIEHHPEHQQKFEAAKKMVDLLSLKQGSRLHQLKELRIGIKQREALQRSLGFKSVAGVDSAVTKRKLSKTYRYLTGAAAAIAIVISFYFIADQYFAYRYSQKVTQDEKIVITSGNALRKTVILADGTLITLGKESSIVLHQQFNAHKRELWLRGEAFFDVKHDVSRPFTVHTVFDEVNVLGTTFNIKAYPGAEAMETALIKGSVQVNSRQYPGYSVILKPNQKLVSNKVYDLNKDRDPHTQFKISAIKSVANGAPPVEIKWVQNRLDIDNQSLSAIAHQLQQWYGIEILITDDAVGKYRYSGIFENETIIKTLEALQLSYPFTFKMEQNRIVISK